MVTYSIASLHSYNCNYQYLQLDIAKKCNAML